jgi:lipopolysaccharide transport system ATP-binding protein
VKKHLQILCDTMTDIAIRVENLGKLYRIGQFGGYKTIRETMTNVMSVPLRLFRHPSQEPRATSHQPNTIWALKDVSFEVKRGEAVGIIGRNGSGKTTILKILSRITAPTEGRAEIHGRVGSLLEVGTGFHPELTGRENIYLNGAVIGMKKAEVERKFDEIVAFAETEKFLDTPVKRYSSGMYVRLAFAVAAHLEPEILIVDEVLAVGDAAFQKKCLGKMSDVTSKGRTVVFVSHNMASITQLCQRAVLLTGGKVVQDGPSREVVSAYLSNRESLSEETVWSYDNAPSSELVRLRAVRVVNEDGKSCFDTDMAKPIGLEIEFWCLRGTRMTPAFHIYNELGILLFFTANLHDKIWAERQYEPGLYRCSCELPGNFLNEGTHSVNAYLSSDINREPDVRLEPAVSFRVHDSGAGPGRPIAGKWLGLIRPLLPWSGDRIGDLP